MTNVKRTTVSYSIEIAEKDSEKLSELQKAAPSVEQLERDAIIKLCLYKLEGQWYARAETSDLAGGINLTVPDQHLISRSLKMIQRRLQGIFRRKQVLSDLQLQQQPSQEAPASAVVASSKK